ncbi:hypothetical protein [Lysobacter enzymogenes]|uniref:hypothetical protein n=1 Tax=Lysobacter enzymogenes TaxID=69 RepID=UPI001A97562A|nr:hypothetical protein [Lysobacter enzymogenes]QQP94081.1 hypothetical protein JHW38_12410 [Lysobacter enzymogenes]
MRKIESKPLSNGSNAFNKALVGLILAGVCAVASASGEPKPFDSAHVLEQQKQIRSDVDAGRGDYAKLEPAKRDELRSRQDRLGQLLQGRSYDQLSASEREQAHQDLAWIAQAGGTVAAAAEPEEKVVCQRVRTIGSNRTEKVCKSVSQRREDQKNRVEPQLDRPGIR